MNAAESEKFGPLLGGTARAWRLKLDERLKPMGLSQAKWRTLLHLFMAPGPLNQAEVATRLGIEEPTVASLLQRLEKAGWVTRKNSPRDRRCKHVHLAPRANRVITKISSTADQLRHELLDDISPGELRTCMRVLNRIRAKAEKANGNGKHAVARRARFEKVGKN